MLLDHFAHPAVKGISRYLHDENLAPDALRLHISEAAAKSRVHAPHQHGGIEAVYMLAGEATIEIEGESFTLGPGEAVVFDPHKMHGISNESNVAMRYLVVRTAE